MRFLKLIVFGVMLSLAVDPSFAFARAGGRASMGSRGARTYTPPPATRTAPDVRPIERSVTPVAPPQAPAPNVASPGLAQPGYTQPSFAQRNPFMTGVLGGLVGAGIGGMLFGHGFGGYGMGGGMGAAGGLGLLLQLLILGGIGWWLYTMFRARGAAPNYAQASFEPQIYAPQPAAPPLYATQAYPSGGQAIGFHAAHAPPPPTPDEIGITQTDFDEFERLLTAVQQAWSKSDIAALRRVVTPEMLSYFSEQLALSTSRGVANTITDVKLEQGDLAESWQEGAVDYATVSLRFSALDYDSDESGRVVEGSATARTQATETWTFMRQGDGGRWLLSAIQQ